MMQGDMPFTPVAGEPFALAPDLALVLAPNPSPMTYLGTNSYILGTRDLVVIDPGPASDSHLAALLAAINGRKVTHILLTHSHLDHSPLSGPLAAATGAGVYAFGDSQAGRSAIMKQLAQAGLTDGGEGIDRAFHPDIHLADGQGLTTGAGQITAHHTPGHIGNHLCFRWNDALFTGDHVMGWSTSLVSPPDGDLTDFMQSCARLEKETAQIFYPGHGAPVTAPQRRIGDLIAHRRAREAQILDALTAGPATIPAVTRQVYRDVAPALLPAAERNVFAHLIDLVQRQLVSAHPTLGVDAEFALVSPQNAAEI